MDIEWGKDGETGRIYVLQARPETVQSRAGRTIQRYSLQQKGPVLATGRSIGQRIGAGPARIIKDIREMARVETGDVLVADMTDPDWEPVMKRAVGDRHQPRRPHLPCRDHRAGTRHPGGRRLRRRHARRSRKASPSRSPVRKATRATSTTASSSSVIRRSNSTRCPSLPVKIMMNVGNPDRAFDFAAIPNKGVGLARLEFIINRMIGVHPKALLEFDRLEPDLKDTIRRQMAGLYRSGRSSIVEKLCEGIGTIAAAFAPEPVIVRLSDFKSNEYANLIGGRKYEPVEENPMLGFRGASRYVDEGFRPVLRARMPRTEARARGDGTDQRLR